MKTRNSTILPEAPCTPLLRTITCLLTILLLLTAGSCKKDKIDKRPSQSGANTLYFEAEGKEWTPAETYMAWDASIEYLDDSLLYISVSTNSTTGDLSSIIDISLYNIKSVGSFVCNNNIRHLFYEENNIRSDDKTCVGCIVRDETVHITRLDTVSKIVSGTFSFVARCNKNDSSLVEIKNGWFDYHYPYNK